MTIDFGFLPQVFLLVLLRVSAVVGIVAFFGGATVPAAIRMGLAVLLALALPPGVPPQWYAAAGNLRTLPDVLYAATGELLLGAAVGLICDALIAACLLAGDIISLQSGLGASTEVDPISGETNPLPAGLLQSLVILIVILNNGHLVLVKLLAQSLYSIPPGEAWLPAKAVLTLLSVSGWAYEAGFKLAAPVLAAAMIVNTAFGLVARLAPDFDILFLALPVRLLAGLFSFALVLRYGAPLISRMIQDTLRGCAWVLAR